MKSNSRLLLLAFFTLSLRCGNDDSGGGTPEGGEGGAAGAGEPPSSSAGADTGAGAAGVPAAAGSGGQDTGTAGEPMSRSGAGPESGGRGGMADGGGVAAGAGGEDDPAGAGAAGAGDSGGTAGSAGASAGEGGQGPLVDPECAELRTEVTSRDLEAKACSPDAETPCVVVEGGGVCGCDEIVADPESPIVRDYLEAIQALNEAGCHPCDPPSCSTPLLVCTESAGAPRCF